MFLDYWKGSVLNWYYLNKFFVGICHNFVCTNNYVDLYIAKFRRNCTEIFTRINLLVQFGQIPINFFSSKFLKKWSGQVCKLTVLSLSSELYFIFILKSITYNLNFINIFCFWKSHKSSVRYFTIRDYYARETHDARDTILTHSFFVKSKSTCVITS